MLDVPAIAISPHKKTRKPPLPTTQNTPRQLFTCTHEPTPFPPLSHVAVATLLQTCACHIPPSLSSIILLRRWGSLSYLRASPGISCISHVRLPRVLSCRGADEPSILTWTPALIIYSSWISSGVYIYILIRHPLSPEENTIYPSLESRPREGAGAVISTPE